MRDRCRGLGLGGFGLLVEAVAQDGLDAAVAMGAEDERAPAGGFQAFFAVALAQAQDPEAGAVALLGMLAFAQHRRDQRAGGRPDGLGPAGRGAAGSTRPWRDAPRACARRRWCGGP